MFTLVARIKQIQVNLVLCYNTDRESTDKVSRTETFLSLIIQNIDE